MATTLLGKTDSTPGRDRRPPARWLPAVLMAAGAVLVLWLVVLAIELPSTATARHWSAAWAGLDAMEAVGLLATGLMLIRRDDRARLTAMAAATLLLADAWLDVVTATAGSGEIVAITLAACCELPAAALCLAVALRRRPVSSRGGSRSAASAGRTPS